MPLKLHIFTRHQNLYLNFKKVSQYYPFLKLVSSQLTLLLITNLLKDIFHRQEKPLHTHKKIKSNQKNKYGNRIAHKQLNPFKSAL